MSPLTLCALIGVAFFMCIPLAVMPTREEPQEPDLKAKPRPGQRPVTCSRGHIHTNAGWARECDHAMNNIMEELQ